MTLAEPGTWLAHYSTAEAVFEHILPSGLLRMSPYRLMRDPFENKQLLITGGGGVIAAAMTPRSTAWSPASTASATTCGC